MGGNPSKRNTLQHDVIRQILAAAGRPLCIAEVVAAARQRIPSLGIATVYRAVKRFIEEGWLVAIEVAGTARFELADTSHHHHFYCQTCDRTFDIKACTTNLRRLVPKGFVISGHELTISGRCRSCTEQARG